MSSVVINDADVQEEAGSATRGRQSRGIGIRLDAGVRSDLVAVACYLAGALWVTGRLWIHARHRILVDAATGEYHGDQLQFEYWLARATQVIIHGWNPFYDGHLNVPVGVNVMANTAFLGLAIPLAPITLLFGPPVAFAAMVILAPFTTALAWYWLFSRHLVASRAAALVGGAICGFGPGMVAQTNAHPNIATQFAVPLIIWQVIQLARDDRYVRHGLILGGLVIYQIFVNEEILLITAIGMLIFGAVWVVSRPALARERSRHVLGGLAVAAGLALAALAFPLWYQFFGPQHYAGLGGIPSPYSTDLYSFTAYPTYSLGGDAQSMRLAVNQTEQDTFFGWGLLVQAFVIAVALRRNVATRCAAITAAVLGVLSLGFALRANGQYISTWGPWRLLVHLPLFGSVICTRIGLGMIPPIAFLTALAIDKIGSYKIGSYEARRGGELRLLAYGGLLAALLPLIPIQVPAVGRPATPAFISSGEWRPYVAPGRSLVSIPFTTQALTMSWAAQQRLGFTMPGGYFLGPDPASRDGSARFGSPPRPTQLLWAAAAENHPPTIQPSDQDTAWQDLRYWHAGVVILAPQPNADTLRVVTTQLLGFPPKQVGGVWLWPIN